MITKESKNLTKSVLDKFSTRSRTIKTNPKRQKTIIAERIDSNAFNGNVDENRIQHFLEKSAIFKRLSTKLVLEKILTLNTRQRDIKTIILESKNNPSIIEKILNISQNDSIANGSPEPLISLRRSKRIKQITKPPMPIAGQFFTNQNKRLPLKKYAKDESRNRRTTHRKGSIDIKKVNTAFLESLNQYSTNFTVIKENEYKCKRVINKDNLHMQCECSLTLEDIENGKWGCSTDCLNRLTNIECGSDCNLGERCSNKKFQRNLSAQCRVFQTTKKGFGVMAEVEIDPGDFILEYVGVVVNGKEFERRQGLYAQQKNAHFYSMYLGSDRFIDATAKGNISRFLNHSCDPNAETQKWLVKGERRIGIFCKKTIMPGEEITFDYEYEYYDDEIQQCFCETSSCRGWITKKASSMIVDKSSENKSDSIDVPNRVKKSAVTTSFVPTIADTKEKCSNSVKNTRIVKAKTKEQKLAKKLTTKWKNLPEIARIRTRSYVKQLKVHEEKLVAQCIAETQSCNSMNGEHFSNALGYKELRNTSDSGINRKMVLRNRTLCYRNNQIEESTKRLSKKERQDILKYKSSCDENHSHGQTEIQNYKEINSQKNDGTDIDFAKIQNNSAEEVKNIQENFNNSTNKVCRPVRKVLRFKTFP